MHPHREKLLKREHDAATVSGLEGLKAQADRIEAKLDQLLEAREPETPAAAPTKAKRP